MDDGPDRIKQQSDEQIKRMETWRVLQERRAIYYAERKKQLEEERAKLEQTKRNKRDKALALKRTIEAIRIKSGGRIN